MASRSWNHNTRYHAALLRSVPSHTHRALDIGLLPHVKMPGNGESLPHEGMPGALGVE